MATLSVKRNRPRYLHKQRDACYYVQEIAFHFSPFEQLSNHPATLSQHNRKEKNSAIASLLTPHWTHTKAEEAKKSSFSVQEETQVSEHHGHAVLLARIHHLCTCNVYLYVYKYKYMYMHVKYMQRTNILDQ